MYNTITSTTSVLKSFFVAFALVMITAACDGPVGPEGPVGADGAQGPRGPEGEDGARGPRGPAGEDGNANVTVYVFDGHDFRAGGDGFQATRRVPLSSEAEFDDSAWLFYLVYDNYRYPVPGFGYAGEKEYREWHLWSSDASWGSFHIVRLFDPEDDAEESIAYSEIRIIRIEGSHVEDCTGGGCLRGATSPEFPADLDISDYAAVVEYYGLTEDDIVRM